MSIPREGIHLGYVLSTVERFITSTTVMATLAGFAILQWAGTLRTSSLTPWTIFFAAALKLNKKLGERSINAGEKPQKVNFDDEVVVVTGGSSGLGESLVRFITSASQKARVVVVDINPPVEQGKYIKGCGLSLLTNAVGHLVRFFACDLSDRTSLGAVANQIKQEVGDPTMLVNNAGLSRGRMLAETSARDVSATLNVNLVAPFLLTRAFLPAMIARNHGHVLNVSSLSAFVPSAGLADYAASKAGLLAMTESLRLELRHVHNARKVRVSAFVFSFVRTPLFKGETGGSEFVSPILHVDTCGEEMFRVLQQGGSVTKFMPTIVGTIASAIQSFPRWLQDTILDGTIKLKVDFKGRQRIDDDGRVLAE
ncbi:hypothetical protein CKM354_001204600 [Cercospora kikuchii]|uniref:Ketoreductase domain-containing protein n=1 Tax=Cercospora kikuchii TaxID=84275 RepID=A0A9P3FLE5_9PEZI|nr:uncharacterized protein CKM354_001204600 [Cercospora kikuchii]GIZ49005.1 hypothetical protein CKM354_001204600 [Cercospora kikuchii]